MIKKAVLSDLDTLVELAYQQNQRKDQWSGFLSSTKSSIENDIRDMMNDDQSFIYFAEEEGVIHSMIMATPNPGLNLLDVMGPFTLLETLSSAKELIHKVTKHMKFPAIQCVVHADSLYYQTLFSSFSNVLLTHEYTLVIHKDQLKNQSARLDVNVAKPKHYPLIQALHNSIFNAVYLTSEDLVDVKDSQILFVLEQTDEIIGYAKVLVMNNTLHLEVIAVREDVRGKGIGKAFLKSVLIKAFEVYPINRMQLMVDATHEKAIRLYQQIGFTEQQKRSIYHISTLE